MKLTHYHNERAFTLVELLIALVISGIILTVIMQVFISSQVSYNVQEDVAAMQQSVRTAKMFIERDVRMAGSGALNLQGPNNKPILALWFENNHGASGTDRLTILYKTPDADPCGALTAPATMLCSDLPTLTLAGDMPPTSAVADVNEDLSVAPYSSWNTTCSCNGTVYLATANKPFIVSTPDQSQSSILLASGINTGANKIQNGPNKSLDTGNLGDPEDKKEAKSFYNLISEAPGSALANKQLNDMPSGSSINFFTPSQMHKATYYVATDGNGISALYRDTGSSDEVIAEHIEDFQCAFELDDGTLVNNRDLTEAEVPDVRLVTLNILGRSSHPHIQAGGRFEGNRPALEDHVAGPADNFRRRLLTVTVKIRNFDLN